MIDQAWVRDRLDSPLFGSLAQMVELTVPAVSADAGAGRIYGVSTPMPLTYVSTGRLGIPRRYESIIHDWPTEQHSVFEKLGDRPTSTGPFRPREVLGSPSPPDQLFGPIEARYHVVDALAVPVVLEEGPWSLLLLFRCGANPPFEPEQQRRVEQLQDQLALALRRGYEVQPSSAPGVKHTGPGRTGSTRAAARRPVQERVSQDGQMTGALPTPATVSAAETEADLLARLSVTERRVLEYLRNQYTERQIGQEFDRSPHTIHVHVKNIYRKLAVTSRKELLQLFESRPEPTTRQ